MTSILQRYKLYVVFLLMVSFGLGLVALVSNGYYPILLVGNHLVSARRFWKNFNSAALYYQNYVRTYGVPPQGSENLSRDVLETSVLNELVDENLVRDGAAKETGPELDGLVHNKIDKYSADANLAQAAQKLYGLNFDDFRGGVLVPQAEREVLAGRLYLQGGNIDDWLKEVRKSARVIVFSPQFRWNGERIERTE